MTRSIRVAPRPPKAFGQDRQAQPPANFRCCHAFEARMTPTVRSAGSLEASAAASSRNKSSGFSASSQARAFARNSLLRAYRRNPWRDLSSGRVASKHRLDKAVFPVTRRTERYREQIGATVMQMTIVLPGEADAAMGLQALRGAQPISLRR